MRSPAWPRSTSAATTACVLRPSVAGGATPRCPTCGGRLEVVRGAAVRAVRARPGRAGASSATPRCCLPCRAAARVSLGEGAHAARSASRRPAHAAGVAAAARQGRVAQPDGDVQGSRDGARRVGRPRRGGAGHRLRVDRQRGRVGGRVRRPGRAAGRDPRPGRDAAAEDGPGRGLRGARRRRPGHLQRCVGDGRRRQRVARLAERDHDVHLSVRGRGDAHGGVRDVRADRRARLGGGADRRRAAAGRASAGASPTSVRSAWSSRCRACSRCSRPGARPIVRAFEEGAPTRPWEAPGTVAGGLADPLAGYPEEGDVTVARGRRVGRRGRRGPDDARSSRRSRTLGAPRGPVPGAGRRDRARRRRRGAAARADRRRRHRSSRA